MANLFRSILVSVILGVAALGAAAPRVLIFQSLQPVKRDIDPNLHLANQFAQALDEQGKLEAVVWSLTDPVFRQAVLDRKIPEIEAPKPKDILDNARGVNAEYVLIVEGFREARRCRAKVELFRSGRSIWKDEQNFGIQTEAGLDEDSSVRSLIRTILVRMDAEPLKSLPTQPTIQTPVPDPGQKPLTMVVPVAPPVKKDNSGVLKESADLIKEGHLPKAISLLRDAVDSDPLDVELRRALVKALMDVDSELAAVEARSAAQVMPEHPELRVMAARAWIAAQQPDEAQVDLNEAIARDPEAFETRLLLTEVSLSQLKPASALEHIDKAIEAQDRADARFLRAMCYSMLGLTTEMNSNWEKMVELGSGSESLDTVQFFFVTDTFDQALQTESNEVRSLMQKAIVRPDDKAVLQEIDRILRQVRGRTAFAMKLAAPGKFGPVNEQRILSYRLMAQCLAGLQSFMAGGGEDTLAGARIDLGEALRNATEVRQAESILRSEGK